MRISDWSSDVCSSDLNPDLVFRPRRKVIFVHGCFWHQHRDCSAGRLPSSNTCYWSPKLRRNIQRDAGAWAVLDAIGWDSIVIWECENKEEASLRKRQGAFVGSLYN